MKRRFTIISLVVVATLLLSILVNFLSANTVSAQEAKTGDVESNSVLFDKGDYVVSPDSKLYYNEYDIGSSYSNVIRVELRDSKGNVIRVLPKASGTKYTLGNIEPSEKLIVKSSRPATINEGYFEWFRDPNKMVWMYDFDGVRTYRNTRTTEYDRPPSSCRNASSVTDTSGTVLDGTCADAWDYRVGTLDPPPMIIELTGDPVALRDVRELSFDSSNFRIRSDRNLSTANILDIQTVTLDPQTLNYRFNYKARYNVPEDQSRWDGQSLLVRWYNSWEIGIKGYVYKYPKMSIWVVYNGTSPTPTISPSPTPAPFGITGDFDILPATIHYRDSFTIRPRNITVTGLGCVYTKHEFKFERAGYMNKSRSIPSKTADLTMTYSDYAGLPAIGSGANNVSLKIYSSCGESDWIGPKPLMIQEPPGNNPPTLEIAWFKQGDRSAPVTEVIQGTVVDLLITQADDPDGDSYTYAFDFAGSPSGWIKSLPAKYGFTSEWFEYDNITTDTGGYHTVTAAITDLFGASGTATAGLNVITPNPVPLIEGPDSVVEGRPLPSTFHADRSYSPITGRTIDHTKDLWGNRKSMYSTPGTEIITLDVTDNTGLKSLPAMQAKHTLTVKPDMPPIPQLQYPVKSVRSTSVSIRNTSYSPDQDTITTNQVWDQYDADNDGNFDEETLVALPMDSNKNISKTFDKVGKHRLKVYNKENWGREATAYFTLEIVNDSPIVTFEVSSQVSEPLVIPSFAVSGSEIVANWLVTNSGSQQVRRNIVDNGNGSITFKQEGLHYPMPIKTTPTLLASKEFMYEDYTSGIYVPEKQVYIVNDQHCICIGGSYVSIYNASGTRVDPNPTGYFADYDLVRDEFYTYDYNDQYYTYKFSDLIARKLTLLATTSGKHDIKPTSYRSTDGRYEKPTDIDLQGRYVKSTFTARNAGETNVISMFNSSGNVVWNKSFQDADSNGTFWRDHYVFTNDYSRFINTKSTFGSSAFKKIDGLELRNSSNGALVKFLNISYISSYLGMFNGYYVFESTGYSWGTSNKLHLVDSNLNIYKTYNTGSDSYRDLDNDGRLYQAIDVPSENSTSYNYYKVFDLRTGMTSNYYPELGLKKYANDRDLFTGSFEYGVSYTDDPAYLKVSAFTGLPDLTKEPVSTRQLYSTASPSLSNFDISFGYKYDTYMNKYSRSGFAFKLQDHKNMYRVEFTGSKLFLYKIVNGLKTELDQADYSFVRGTSYSFKINSISGRHKIYVNGVPVLDAVDHGFGAGKFGPMTDFYDVTFKNITYSDLTALASTDNPVKDAVLVGSTVAYSSTFADPESDPTHANLTWWKYEHVNPNVLLNAGDGKSGLSSKHGTAGNGKLTSLDRVGLWRISHYAKDDPHPNYRFPSNVFDGYRQLSNTFARNVVVHRKPVSRFTVSVNGSGVVQWTDQSYDPDRWLNSTTYSAGYQANRGIFNWKYYYITPGGRTVSGKLVRPSESGAHTVGMAVMDEYGAWSDWYEQTVTAATGLPPNQPPVPDFASPAAVYRDTVINLVNRSADPDGDAMTYSWKVMLAPYSNTFSTAATPVGFKIMDYGRGKNAVSSNWFIGLTVTDSKGESGSIMKPLTVVNRIPTASITGPHSAGVNATIAYSSGATDADTEDAANLSYYWHMTSPSGIETDWTGANTNVTFTETGTYLLEHWVVDQLDARSNTAFQSIFVNTQPVVELTVPSGWDAANPSVNIPPFRAAWTYSDANNDPQTASHFRVYQYGTNALVINVQTNSGNKFHDVPAGLLTGGKTYYAVVRAYDGTNWSVDSARKYFILNRPPVADFDWTPKPVWEGDTVRLLNRSADPDGDSLHLEWKIKLPDSREIVGDAQNMEIKFGEAGTYQVTLTVSDGYESRSVTKLIRAEPLTIHSEVNHTPEWLAKHEELGHRTESPPKEFYSGEVMLVSIVSSAAPVSEAWAWIDAVGLDGEPLQAEVRLEQEAGGDGSLHVGELYDERLSSLTERLPDGPCDVRFLLQYANGVEKRETVQVTIIGSVHESVGVHRVQ